MFIPTRRPGEFIFINLAESVNLATPVGNLCANVPIEVDIRGVKWNQVTGGTQAPNELNFVREELVQ